MNIDDRKKGNSPQGWKALLGLLWCAVVLFSYYYSNAGYYHEKITTFGRFFLRFIE